MSPFVSRRRRLRVIYVSENETWLCAFCAALRLRKGPISAALSNAGRVVPELERDREFGRPRASRQTAGASSFEISREELRKEKLYTFWRPLQKVLWLNENRVERLAGLEALADLRVLWLCNNKIEYIGNGTSNSTQNPTRIPLSLSRSLARSRSLS